MTTRLVLLKLFPHSKDNMFDEMQISIMVLSEICYVCGDKSIKCNVMICKTCVNDIMHKTHKMSNNTI